MTDDWHRCHFCGDYVKAGLDTKGERHWLSDCRPDLVEHVPGPLCTWHGLNNADGEPAHVPDCYAYRNADLKITDSHSHFYTDGPM